MIIIFFLAFAEVLAVWYIIDHKQVKHTRNSPRNKKMLYVLLLLEEPKNTQQEAQQKSQRKRMKAYDNKKKWLKYQMTMWLLTRFFIYSSMSQIQDGKILFHIIRRIFFSTHE